MLSKFVADCVSVVFTCKVVLINRDMTKLIIDYIIFRKASYNGKKSSYVEFFKLKSVFFYVLFTVHFSNI